MPRAESPGAGRSGIPVRTAANRGGEALMIPVTYAYARVSKSDRGDRNLETQLRELANHCIREELVFSDVMTGRLMSRPGWDGLMARVQAERHHRGGLAGPVQPQLRRGHQDPWPT